MPRSKNRPAKRSLDSDLPASAVVQPSINSMNTITNSLKECANFQLKVLFSDHKDHDDPLQENITLCLRIEEDPLELNGDFKLYVNIDTPGQSFILENNRYYLIEETSILPHLETFEGLYCNKAGLILVLKQCDPFELNVKFCSHQLKPLEHPSQLPAGTSWATRALSLRYFLGQTIPEESTKEGEEQITSTKLDIDSIYDAIKNYHLKNSIPLIDSSPLNPQHPSLKPKLRPCRGGAVVWMINQEKAPLQSEKLHSLFLPIMDSKYYINKHSGYIVKEFPSFINRPPGGILADEMGLGKTVEIISLIFCHPRTEVQKPPYMEPEQDIIESFKRCSRRRRAISPVEFEIQPPLELELETQAPSPGEVEIKEEVIIPQCDGMDEVLEDELSNLSHHSSDFESDGGDLMSDEEEVQKPRASTSSRKEKKSKAKSLESNDSSDEDNAPSFDPYKLLKCKKVTEKSTLADLIIYSLIKLCKGNYKTVISGQVIKKAVEKDYSKTGPVMNKRLNKALVNLVKKRTLRSTSRNASGSFCFNRSGRSSVMIKSKNKNSKVYHKLKAMYEQELNQMSMIKDESYKKAGKRWKGSYFDTTVHQKDFFECICGADEYEDNLSRVQCSVCTIRQHAECVKYNLRDPYRGEYKCPHCWSESDPVQSKGTLIVSPDSISYQWIEEIQKHVTEKGLKILYYKGTKASGYIQPRDLGSYDVVVTTYSVLKSETDHVDIPHSNSQEGRKLRNPKRFMAIPAPLPSVQWWRVCLDEAQMIEGTTTTKTAQMALRLSSVNKWCVTGTPIGKSVNDLYGLFLFLGYDPYSVSYWWKTLVYNPYSKRNVPALEELLAEVMWRTAKRDILNQISIPSQTEQIHWLSFSPIEEHYYRRQHVESSKEIVAKIRRLPNHDLKLSELDRNLISSILQPMLKLRQCCCHPQVVKGEFISLQKSSITMEELLNQMIKKNTTECEENHRAHISSLNGLAGIHIIKEEWKEAVQVYRDVLGLVAEYEGNIKTDMLQMLHTLTNLSEILEAKHEGISPTLRDSSLIVEASKLKSVYLSKYKTAVSSAEGALSPVTNKVMYLLKKNESSHSEPWYVEAINSISTSAAENSLLNLVKDEMAQFYDVVNDREFNEISAKYSNPRIIMYKIVSGLTNSDNLRTKVLKGMKKLKDSPIESYVNAAVDCHLRTPALGYKKKCVLCSVHDDIEAYEKSIFHFVKGDLKSNKVNRSSLSLEQNQKLEEAGVFLLENQRIGNWAESETERLIRAVLKYLRTTKLSSSDLIEEGVNHLTLIEATKKEFKLVRILWRQIHDMVAAMDELNMCVMRLRLKYPDEIDPLDLTPKRKKISSKPSYDLATREKDKYEGIYIIEKHEIPSQRLKLMYEKTVAKNEFRKKYGQLLYLENLKKTDFKKNGGENPDPCPICQKELGKQWSVLQCGHSYCIECIRTLIDEYLISTCRSVMCPMCRSMTYHSEISYVNMTREESLEIDEEAADNIKGSLSTKVESIVKTLFIIQKSDPSGKTLIFSAWPDLLDIIGMALFENNIPCTALHAHNKFNRNLLKFKNRDDVKVLLLPISSGANGLNLVEARHVFLVEPILNPAQELQAIGRVHRIGQTKPTVIHRFLIRNTVEERMHKILGSYHKDEAEQGSHSTEENLITIKDLKNIFNDYSNDGD